MTSKTMKESWKILNLFLISLLCLNHLLIINVNCGLITASIEDEEALQSEDGATAVNSTVFNILDASSTTTVPPEKYITEPEVKDSTTTTSSTTTSTTTTMVSKTGADSEAEEDGDEDDDSEDNESKESTAKVKSISVPETNMKAPKFTEEEKDEEEEDDDSEDLDECDTRLSTFVRSFDGASFLPDDYQELQDFMQSNSIYGNVHHINDTLAILDRTAKVLEKVRNNKDLSDTMMYVSSVMGDKAYEAKISTECMADLAAMGSAIRNLEPWAFKFPDSFGSLFLAGMMHGQFSSFGQFDQCIGIKSPVQENGRHIYGQYCSLQFAAITPPIEAYDSSWEEIFRSHPYFSQYVLDAAKKFNIDHYVHRDFALFITQATDSVNDNIFHSGICLPQTCSAEEVAKLLNQIIYPLTKMSVRIEEKLCDTHPDLKKLKLDKFQWTSIITITAISVFIGLCTIIHLLLSNVNNKKATQFSSDLNNGNNNEKCSNQNILSSNLSRPSRPAIYQRFIQSFSVVANTRKLVHFQTSLNRFPIIDALKCVFTLLIFPVNSLGLPLLFYPEFYRNTDGLTRREILHSNGHWTVQMPGLWFDGLVFVFGVLLSLNQFKRLKRSFGDFSYTTYLIKRWFRLSVALVGTILLLYLLPLLGNGPMWFYNDQAVVAPCRSRRTLASSLLYYSNWNDALDGYFTRSSLPICNPQTWFLSSVGQLYLLAPLLFLPLYYWPTFGYCLGLLVLLLSPLAAIAPRLLTGYPSYLETTKFTSFDSNAQAVTHSHMNPALYLTSLTVGLLTGYLIRVKPKLKFGGRLVERIFWLISFGSVGYIFIWHRSFKVQNVLLPVESVVGWFAYYKCVWSLFLGYTTYLFATGRLEAWNRMITCQAVQIVAKLSYCIYLLRGLVVFYRQTSARQAAEIFYYENFQNIFFDFLLTIGLAYLLHLLFEAPILRLIELFEGTDSDSNDEQVRVHGNSGFSAYQSFVPSVGSSTEKLATPSSGGESKDPSKDVVIVERTVELPLPPAYLTDGI